jgi:hypothetical protein
LVTCVTLPVKLVRLPTMRLDVPSIPRTMDAANAAPGSVGRLTCPEGREPPLEAVAGAEAVRLGAVRAQGW